jgi:hypothetical protein
VPTGPGIVTVIRIDAADKLSPDLGTAGFQLGTQQLTAIVEFHGDVPADQQDTLAAAEGLTLQHSAVLLAPHAIVTGTLSDVKALASHDEVAYIFPADPTLLTDSNFSACAGMLTLSGSIPQYANLVHGWTPDSDNVAHLGYVFGTMTTKVPASLVQSEIVRALNAWARITNVTFQPGTIATAARTLAIKFASGAHGDAYPFDGPGGVLAHTFYPVPVNPESIAGDMHLDADENWHSGNDVDIYTVALHEAGHAIGLGHSDKPGDVMYPYYRRGMSLSANDIGAAQALYGAPNATVTAAPAPVTTPTITTTPATAAAALRINFNAAPSSTRNGLVVLTGTISGGAAPFSVQWQTDHGYSGQAALGGVNWTASGISMVNGSNTISVTAFDANHQAATQSATMTLVPASGTTQTSAPSAPVAVAITAPSGAVVTVNNSTLSIGGTASGGSGITRVAWQTSNGASGTATGTTHWLISGIPVLQGTNTVVVRAYDSNGNTAWAAVVAVRN